MILNTSKFTEYNIDGDEVNFPENACLSTTGSEVLQRPFLTIYGVKRLI